MPVAISTYKQALLAEIENVSEETLRELLDFTYFLKAKPHIDPSQTYFWTTSWQRMERSADDDRAAGKILGEGTTISLLEELSQFIEFAVN